MLKNKNRVIVILSLVYGSLVAQPHLTTVDSLDIGNVQLNTTGTSILYLKNTGISALIITDIVSSNNALRLALSIGVVTPNDSIADTLYFSPRKAYEDTASIFITSNDASSQKVIKVSMYGVVVIDPSTISYRNDQKGDLTARREGIMDGNQIRTLYYNHGEVAKWTFSPSCEWPKGSGHTYLDGVAVLFGAKTVAPGNFLDITPIESAYREEVDKDPVTGQEWVLQPIPGYDNPQRRGKVTPAINRDTTTFPSVWPAALGLDPSWNGYWYGYFGRGVTNSDFETFFVMDDSKDKEFTRQPYCYYPIAEDSARGGLGLRIEVRGFQWSHVLAEDIIFWHYDIVNISDWNYDSTCFGFYTDPGVGSYGQQSPPNSARYDSKLDLAYAWSTTGVGFPDNWKTGYVGYAYLESPGNGTDGIDNDEDEMIDERRDDNIDNDHDWIPYTDLNGNGKWDPGEPLNDDLGRDGVGPDDPQYIGPDEGEGDGIPTHGEPNFDETDKDESDQIGLSSAAIWNLADKGPSGGWPKNDDIMWQKMNSGFQDTAITNTNISMTFSSGPFPLKQGKRERFSMALALGEDLDDLIFNKETVQQIYNANYNFSKPPYTPHLAAVPGNRRVFLYWDDIAEKSIDRFMGWQDSTDHTKGYKRDFEGYLVYRSSEAEFTDIKTITDSKGIGMYWKPIAQFDLVDNISGPDPVGIRGASFWRGSNTGLQHSYIDTTVLNGMRYYYAVVSYDMGDPKRGTSGLQPTECPKIIREDYSGVLEFVDINCAVITPNAPTAGYMQATAEGDLRHVVQGGLGTGSLSLTILNPALLQDDDEYTVTFKADSVIPYYKTSSCNIMQTRGGITDTLVRDFSAHEFGANKTSPPFNGMILSILNDTLVTVIDTASGWVVGTSKIVMLVAPDNSNSMINYAWPADYEIKFFDSVVDTTAIDAAPDYPLMQTNFTITNITAGYRVKCVIFDTDYSSTLTLGDTIRVIEGDINADFKLVYKITYGRPLTGVVDYPKPGDRYVFKTTKQFNTGDQFKFKTHGMYTDKIKAKEQLSQITVVPNPYIATASWERRTLYASGRGDRKIEFKKLPAKCTVRIYTVSGALVKTLYKDSLPLDGSLAWDLISDDGMEVAYGLYIFHVKAPKVGEYIGKFAIVK